MDLLVLRAFVKYAVKSDGCSFKKDDKGWYVHTHRARSKSYPSKEAIPESVKRQIGSTG